jgi:nucleotide-binding universal stress UspA family protein
MKNLLVPTDFSQCAEYAASAAYLIAKRFGGKMHLVTSLDLPAKWDKMSAVERLADKQAQQTILQGETMLSELKKWFADIEVETAFVGRNLLDGIKKYVKDQGIDLVVMGSHGASGKNEFFIGSNTQKVVRTVHCPVLVIKNPLEKIDFQRVVFASSFNEGEMPAFERFKDFIKHYVPEVHLVSINTSPFDAPYPVQKEIMKPFVEACEPLVCKTHVYRDLSIDEGIRSFAKETGADLVAISNHERHPLKRMLIGSNVELLVNHADLPVLTIDFE